MLIIQRAREASLPVLGRDGSSPSTARFTQRSFFALLLVTVIAFAGAIAAVFVAEAQSRPDPLGGDPVFPLLVERKADVTQVTLESRRWTVVLEKRGDEWVTRYVDTFSFRLFSAIRLPDDVLASRSIIVPPTCRNTQPLPSGYTPYSPPTV